MKPYVVHIWDHAAPADWQGVLRLRTDLDSSSATPGSGFAALAARLQLLHPVAHSEHCFWAEGLDAPGGNDWSLALNPLWLGRALNLLVPLAGEHGLLVFDAEQQVLALPGGRVLRPSGWFDWQPFAEEVLPPQWLTNQHFESEQRRVVLPHLARHGFQVGHDEGGSFHFNRSTSVGPQSLWIANGREGDVCRFLINVEMAIRFPGGLENLVQEPWALGVEMEAPTGPLARFFRPRAGHHHFPGHLLAKAPEELALLLKLTAQWLEDTVLPLLNACSSHAGLLSHATRKPGDKLWIKPNFALLALAHWQGVADFDHLAALVLAQHTGDRDLWARKAIARIQAWQR
jgi:hypothetical protein